MRGKVAAKKQNLKYSLLEDVVDNQSPILKGEEQVRGASLTSHELVKESHKPQVEKREFLDRGVLFM